MTKLMEALLQRAATLDPDIQDRLAQEWLEELEDERKWDEAFANSHDALDKMAQAALQRHREGKSLEKGWDEL